MLYTIDYHMCREQIKNIAASHVTVKFGKQCKSFSKSVLFCIATNAECLFITVSINCKILSMFLLFASLTDTKAQLDN